MELNRLQGLEQFPLNVLLLISGLALLFSKTDITLSYLPIYIPFLSVGTHEPLHDVVLFYRRKLRLTVKISWALSNWHEADASASMLVNRTIKPVVGNLFERPLIVRFTIALILQQSRQTNNIGVGRLIS